MAVQQVLSGQVVCHCLGITETQVRSAVERGEAESIRCVMNCTGAGSGCTACHARIRSILGQPAQSPSSSPTCVMR